MSKMQSFLLTGLWSVYCEDSGIVEELVIQSVRIEDIVEKVLEETEEPGTLKIFSIDRDARTIIPIKEITILNKLELCMD